MKRLLMLNPSGCGSGDTRVFGIYEVLEDKLIIYNDDPDGGTEYDYSKDKEKEYPEAVRWVSIKDESSTDDFEIDEDYCVVCEDDNELAHALIDHIDGLGMAIVNMANIMAKR